MRDPRACSDEDRGVSCSLGSRNPRFRGTEHARAGEWVYSSWMSKCSDIGMLFLSPLTAGRPDLVSARDLERSLTVALDRTSIASPPDLSSRTSPR